MPRQKKQRVKKVKGNKVTIVTSNIKVVFNVNFMPGCMSGKLWLIIIYSIIYIIIYIILYFQNHFYLQI